jgi:hypothetical protein
MFSYQNLKKEKRGLETAKVRNKSQPTRNAQYSQMILGASEEELS